MEETMFFKKVFSLLICMLLMMSCVSVPYANAVAEISQNAEVSIQPREILTLSKTLTCTAANGYKINVKVKYTVQADPSNTSGYLITGILSAGSATVSNGWDDVKSDVTINSISYSDNRQKATINITYWASVGLGYTSYTGTVTLRI